MSGLVNILQKCFQHFPQIDRLINDFQGAYCGDLGYKIMFFYANKYFCVFQIRYISIHHKHINLSQILSVHCFKQLKKFISHFLYFVIGIYIELQ